MPPKGLNRQRKQTALYRISFRFKQDAYQGFNSYRSLSVNGNIPYSEASEIAFGYDDNWQTLCFDKYILLNEGENEMARLTDRQLSAVKRIYDICIWFLLR